MVGRGIIEKKMVKITIRRRQAKKQTNWFLVVSSVFDCSPLVAAGLYSVFGVSRNGSTNQWIVGNKK